MSRGWKDSEGMVSGNWNTCVEIAVAGWRVGDSLWQNDWQDHQLPAETWKMENVPNELDLAKELSKQNVSQWTSFSC